MQGLQKLLVQHPFFLGWLRPCVPLKLLKDVVTSWSLNSFWLPRILLDSLGSWRNVNWSILGMYRTVSTHRTHFLLTHTRRLQLVHYKTKRQQSRYQHGRVFPIKLTRTLSICCIHLFVKKETVLLCNCAYFIGPAFAKIASVRVQLIHPWAFKNGGPTSNPPSVAEFLAYSQISPDIEHILVRSTDITHKVIGVLLTGGRRPRKTFHLSKCLGDFFLHTTTVLFKPCTVLQIWLWFRRTVGEERTEFCHLLHGGGHRKRQAHHSNHSYYVSEHVRGSQVTIRKRTKISSLAPSGRSILQNSPGSKMVRNENTTWYTDGVN